MELSQCSQPEYILSLFLMKHKEVLEAALGFDFERIQLEKIMVGIKSIYTVYAHPVAWSSLLNVR